jgi:hypothetical protein
MAEIVTLLVHRGVAIESLAFRCDPTCDIRAELVADVASLEEAELTAHRLRRIVDVLDVVVEVSVSPADSVAASTELVVSIGAP